MFLNVQHTHKNKYLHFHKSMYNYRHYTFTFSNMSTEVFPLEWEWELSISSTARQWRNRVYRVRARVANLVAHARWSKVLPEDTQRRLREEILDILESLADEKKLLSDNPKMLRSVLTSTMRQEELWKNKQRKTQWKYDRTKIDTLMNIPKTESEVFFVQEFLTITGIRRSHIERIIMGRPLTQE